MKINNLKNYVKLCLLLSLIIVVIFSEVSSKKRNKKHKRKGDDPAKPASNDKDEEEDKKKEEDAESKNKDSSKCLDKKGNSIDDVNGASLGKKTQVVLPCAMKDPKLKNLPYPQLNEKLTNIVYDWIFNLMGMKEDAEKCKTPLKAKGVLPKFLRGIIEYGSNYFQDTENATEFKEFRQLISSDQCPKDFKANFMRNVKDKQTQIKAIINEFTIPRIRRLLRKAGLKV